MSLSVRDEEVWSTQWKKGCFLGRLGCSEERFEIRFGYLAFGASLQSHAGAWYVQGSPEQHGENLSQKTD